MNLLAFITADSIIRRALDRALVVATLLVASGCTTVGVAHLPKADQLPLADAPDMVAEPQYLIRTGDELDIKFPYTPELNESVKVRPDGFITLQMIDDIKAAGLTPGKLDESLTTLYQGRVKDPNLSVIVRSFTSFRAYVGGEVSAPRMVSLEGSVSAMQAIMLAGGLRTTAYPQSAILIRKGPQGEPVPYHLDLTEGAMARGQRDLRIALLPSDVLYIPRSPIANGNLFVQQYVVDLFLFRGINLGYSVVDTRGRTENVFQNNTGYGTGSGGGVSSP